MLLSIHFAAAKFLNVAELELADEEVERLAIACQKVSEQYDTVLSPKMLAWLNLGGVAGAIYGTRIYALVARKKAEAPARPNVVDFKKEGAGKGAQINVGASGANGAAVTPADIFGLNYTAAIGAEA